MERFNFQVEISGAVVMFRKALFFGAFACSTAMAAPLDAFRDCEECPEMIELPAGKFIMGSRAGEVQHGWFPDDPSQTIYTGDQSRFTRKNEQPALEVEVDIPFAMSRNEITYSEWMFCVRDGGCKGYTPPDLLYRTSGPFIGGEHPVTRVSFSDAKNYAAWLNKKIGTDFYRLPTEAEWEYAARAGTVTRYAQGDTINAEQANFSGKMTSFVTLEDGHELVDREAVVRVSMLDAANAWGIRHMSGNAQEWTLSCESRSYQEWSRTSVWLKESSTNCPKRVTRGGNYLSSMNTIRVAARHALRSDIRLDFVWFRVIKVIK